MILKIKNGDSFLEVDTDFPDDQIETFSKIEELKDFENDTIEFKLDELNGDNNG